jgi:hypothetical protein
MRYIRPENRISPQYGREELRNTLCLRFTVTGTYLHTACMYISPGPKEQKERNDLNGLKLAKKERSVKERKHGYSCTNNDIP